MRIEATGISIPWYVVQVRNCSKNFVSFDSFTIIIDLYKVISIWKGIIGGMNFRIEGSKHIKDP